jgi:hypothetical protein
VLEERRQPNSDDPLLKNLDMIRRRVFGLILVMVLTVPFASVALAQYWEPPTRILKLLKTGTSAMDVSVQVTTDPSDPELRPEDLYRLDADSSVLSMEEIFTQFGMRFDLSGNRVDMRCSYHLVAPIDMSAEVGTLTLPNEVGRSPSPLTIYEGATAHPGVGDPARRDPIGPGANPENTNIEDVEVLDIVSGCVPSLDTASTVTQDSVDSRLLHVKAAVNGAMDLDNSDRQLYVTTVGVYNNSTRIGFIVMEDPNSSAVLGAADYQVPPSTTGPVEVQLRCGVKDATTGQVTLYDGWLSYTFIY